MPIARRSAADEACSADVGRTVNKMRRSLLQQGLMAAPLLAPILSATTGWAESSASTEQWYWYPGHVFSFKSIGKDTGNTCTWMLVENSPREGVPFHKHLHEDESFYVLDGRFEITVGDATVVGQAGTYLYGPRDVPHRWTNVGDARGRLLSVLAPSGLEDYFFAAAVPIKSPSEDPHVDVAELQARTAPLREKFGIMRTGPLKYPKS